MDYPNFVVSNQKEESISIQGVKSSLSIVLFTSILGKCGPTAFSCACASSQMDKDFHKSRFESALSFPLNILRTN